MEFKRYAVYFTPPPGPLAAFGAGWFGWDGARGETARNAAPPGLPLPRDAITETPRRYGLHATVKPPFRLAKGKTPEDLQAALHSFCADTGPVTLSGLELAQLGRFLALVPDGPAAPLGALAAGAVETLDSFRAPPDSTELARRRAAGLTPAQDALLHRWGYPYVMEEFRFHITLTGPIPDPAERDKVAMALAPLFEPLIESPFRIDDVCLFGEGQDGKFRNLHRYTLTG